MSRCPVRMARAHLCAAMMATSCLFGVAHSSATVDASRAAIVRFQKGAATIPLPGRSIPLPDAAVRSQRVRQALAATNAQWIECAFPNFELSDTLGVARSGEVVRLTDWSDVYLIQFPAKVNAVAFADSIEGDSSIVYVEVAEPAELYGAVYPNDPEFRNGAQWGPWNFGQDDGLNNADVDAPQAWGITTGAPGMLVSVVDNGVARTPEDLAGRVVGSTTVATNHGTWVAGVLGASANNGKGIAGIHWSPTIYNAYIGNTQASTAQAVIDATDAGALILNNSWGLHPPGTWSGTVRAAFADAYKLNRVAVAAMGNTQSFLVQYPAGFPGVIAVGNTTRDDERFFSSTMGPHIDVSGPGTDITTTDIGVSSYVRVTGTSFASPHVAGAAALLLTHKPSLYNDDVEQIIRLSADDLGPAGWDSAYGMGRLNIRKALELASPPNQLTHSTVNGGQITSSTGWFNMSFVGVAGLTDGFMYRVRRHEVRESFIYLPPFPTGTAKFWGRGVGSIGFNSEEPNFGVGWCEPVFAGVGGATLRTFVYEVTAVVGGMTFPQGWFPGTPSQVKMNFTRLQIAPEPSVATSFFVPEAGTVANPTVGTVATRLFRTCPNNDGGASLPSNARIRIVLKDASGAPVSGVPPEQIYVGLNGGTPAQGFVGDGADSVVANSQFNPGCPDARYLNADAPTDPNGVTFITFTGATAGNPGVGTRDPMRKWGHYDSELPVYVRGMKLEGRLTSTSSNGSYVLQIKNFDFDGGLDASLPLNQGESVGPTEANIIANNVGSTNWWWDLDSDGSVGAIDFNIIAGHATHDCVTPSP